MKTTLTITHDHLARALAVPWNTTTCLTSQAVQEKFGVEVVRNGRYVMLLADDTQINCPVAVELSRDFDVIHGHTDLALVKHLLSKFQLLLPCTIEIEVTPPSVAAPQD